MPLRVDLRDRIQALMWCNAYEPEMKAVFHAFVRNGCVVLDVGAHVGYFSLLACGLVGEKGRVHAFEPDPDCFAKLRANAKRFSQITPWNMAVADRAGFVPLHRSPCSTESGWGSILEAPGEERTRVQVRSTTLDAWLQTQPVDRVDFVKIDAEGAEYGILAGSQRLFHITRPIVVFEVNEGCLARDARLPSDLFRLIEPHGYGIWSVESGNRRPTGLCLGLPEGTRLDALTASGIGLVPAA
jgi:FkbM family methyltransferase